MGTKPLDRIEQIANDAQIATAVLGNPSSGDFELVALDVRHTEAHRQALTARGCFFIGIIGVVNGGPQVALEEPLDDTTIDALSASFLLHIEHRLTSALRLQVEQQALEGWLSRLSVDA